MMNKTTFEQELDTYGICIFQTVGNSMEPFIHNRKSSIIIEKSSAPYKLYDAVLFKRPNGTFVLHRIVKVRKNYYLICGDNSYHFEKVPKSWIVGKMTGFYPDINDTFISCKDDNYQRSVKKIWNPYWWRYFQKQGLRLRQLLKKIRNNNYTDI